MKIQAKCNKDSSLCPSFVRTKCVEDINQALIRTHAYISVCTFAHRSTLSSCFRASVKAARRVQ